METMPTEIDPRIINAEKFQPTDRELAEFGRYDLTNTALFEKPADVAEKDIAYNPSEIWTVHEADGTPVDIMYVRVEPNRSDSTSSHLGKSRVIPYVVDVNNPNTPLVRYEKAQEFIGEDPALTKVMRRNASGELEEVWLLSFVDPKPKADAPDQVETLCTRFYAGTDLNNLEHIADGPEWMKDIRVVKADGPLGTEIDVYGRPQSETGTGNITYTRLNSLDELTAENIAAAPYIDEDLLPIGSGVWGGVNGVIKIAPNKNLLLAHRAWRTGEGGRGRHYESVVYGHDTESGRIFILGIFNAGQFPESEAKDDASVDLSDVAFTGGGYNGTTEHVTFGVRDSRIAIGQLVNTYQ